MSDWTLRYSRQAQKDARRLAASNLKNRAQRLLDIIADDPFTRPPAYERLVGDLAGYYSRRINIQHQLVYEVHPEERVILIMLMNVFAPLIDHFVIQRNINRRAKRAIKFNN